MLSNKNRRIIGIVILLISLTILLWGIMPAAVEVRTLPISPTDMQLPDSGILLLGVL